MPNYVYDATEGTLDPEGEALTRSVCGYPDGLVRVLDHKKLARTLYAYQMIKRFATDYGAKASFLLDYDHSRCILQLENLRFIAFHTAEEKDAFAGLIAMADGCDFERQPPVGFRMCLHADLFYACPIERDAV